MLKEIELDKVEQEIKEIMKDYKMTCSVEDFDKCINFTSLSKNRKLSEDFIRKFENRIIWINIFLYQNQLSEKFRDEFMWKLKD